MTAERTHGINQADEPDNGPDDLNKKKQRFVKPEPDFESYAENHDQDTDAR